MWTELRAEIVTSWRKRADVRTWEASNKTFIHHQERQILIARENTIRLGERESHPLWLGAKITEYFGERSDHLSPQRFVRIKRHRYGWEIGQRRMICSSYVLARNNLRRKRDSGLYPFSSLRTFVSEKDLTRRYGHSTCRENIFSHILCLKELQHIHLEHRKSEERPASKLQTSLEPQDNHFGLQLYTVPYAVTGQEISEKLRGVTPSARKNIEDLHPTNATATNLSLYQYARPTYGLSRQFWRANSTDAQKVSKPSYFLNLAFAGCACCKYAHLWYVRRRRRAGEVEETSDVRKWLKMNWAAG